MTDLRQEILEKVKEFYLSEHKAKNEEFTPGKDTITFAGRVYDEDELVSLVDSALDFWLTEGRYIDVFEKEICEFTEMKNASLTTSGSSANLLALSSLTSKSLGDKRLKKGDEVIGVAAGFPTTVNPIIQNGLVPVFVDVELGTYNINADLLEKALSEKTRAIMIAHTLGNPFDLKKVSDFAKKHDLYLIEDCCDALGSKYDNNLVGTFGDLATVSFYPAHHITMGEGGVVLTNDMKIHRSVRSFRDWGRDCYCKGGRDNTCTMRFNRQFGTLPFGYDHKYVYSNIGYNLKITEMQAAIGVAQLKKLPGFIDARKENFKKLYKGLEQFKDYLILPRSTDNSDPSWFAFPMSLKEENCKFTRRDLTTYLEENKIRTRLLFAGNITRQPAYEDVNYRVATELTNTDYVMNNTFFIGVYPGLTDEKIDYVIKVFEEFFYKQVK